MSSTLSNSEDILQFRVLRWKPLQDSVVKVIEGVHGYAEDDYQGGSEDEAEEVAGDEASPLHRGWSTSEEFRGVLGTPLSHQLLHGVEASF